MSSSLPLRRESTRPALADQSDDAEKDPQGRKGFGKVKPTRPWRRQRDREHHEEADEDEQGLWIEMHARVYFSTVIVAVVRSDSWPSLAIATSV
jgi:hypothetical protein